MNTEPSTRVSDNTPDPDETWLDRKMRGMNRAQRRAFLRSAEYRQILADIDAKESNRG